jgi:hypothetical protein
VFRWGKREITPRIRAADEEELRKILSKLSQ